MFTVLPFKHAHTKPNAYTVGPLLVDTELGFLSAEETKSGQPNAAANFL